MLPRIVSLLSLHNNTNTVSVSCKINFEGAVCIVIPKCKQHAVFACVENRQKKE